MPCCLVHNDRDLDEKLLEIHHKHPTSYGGNDAPENKCWLCPSCHDAVHRISHSFYASRIGEGRDLITQYLPNQPARQQRIETLCRIVADAKRAHQTSGEVPEAGEAEEEFVKMTIRVPAWAHHRIKTATLGKGLYKSIEALVVRHALDLTKSSGGEEAPKRPGAAEVLDASGSGALPIIDLTRPE